jgi:glyoxylase-like metal-dependent hydrolase (beta-lactamase superfamily II)
MSQTVQNFICVACGTEYPESAKPPEDCPVCQDDRQFVPPEGQQWTTLVEMRGKYHNVMEPEEPGLFSIHTEPAFAITQRAFLIATPDGNILWDCLTMLDDASISAVRERGGIKAIAISHPHYYSSMIEWSRAFDARIFLHENDQRWVMRPDAASSSGAATPGRSLAARP